MMYEFFYLGINQIPSQVHNPNMVSMVNPARAGIMTNAQFPNQTMQGYRKLKKFTFYMFLISKLYNAI